MEYSLVFPWTKQPGSLFQDGMPAYHTTIHIRHGSTQSDTMFHQSVVLLGRLATPYSKAVAVVSFMIARQFRFAIETALISSCRCTFYQYGPHMTVVLLGTTKPHTCGVVRIHNRE